MTPSKAPTWWKHSMTYRSFSLREMLTRLFNLFTNIYWTPTMCQALSRCQTHREQDRWSSCLSEPHMLVCGHSGLGVERNNRPRENKVFCRGCWTKKTERSQSNGERYVGVGSGVWAATGRERAAPGGQGTARRPVRGPGPRGPGQQATEGLTAPGKVWEYYAEKVVGPCGSEQGNYTLWLLSQRDCP